MTTMKEVRTCPSATEFAAAIRATVAPDGDEPTGDDSPTGRTTRAIYVAEWLNLQLPAESVAEQTPQFEASCRAAFDDYEWVPDRGSLDVVSRTGTTPLSVEIICSYLGERGISIDAVESLKLINHPYLDLSGIERLQNLGVIQIRPRMPQDKLSLASQLDLSKLRLLTDVSFDGCDNLSTLIVGDSVRNVYLSRNPCLSAVQVGANITTLSCRECNGLTSGDQLRYRSSTELSSPPHFDALRLEQCRGLTGRLALPNWAFNMTELSVVGTPICGIADLHRLGRLNTLHAGETGTHSFDREGRQTPNWGVVDLRALKQLREVDFHGCLLTGILLNDLPNLRTVQLRCLPLSELDLTGSSKVDYLDLTQTPLTDFSKAPGLFSIKRLRELHLPAPALTDNFVAEVLARMVGPEGPWQNCRVVTSAVSRSADPAATSRTSHLDHLRSIAAAHPQSVISFDC